MRTNTITKNSKVIGHLLSLNHKVPVIDLLAISCLESIDFYIAVGWLAREGCISFTIGEEKELFISKTDV